MEKKGSLAELIKGKWFDRYQSGLMSRFAANGMTYGYHYHESDSITSVMVILAKGNIKTRIELNEFGYLNFRYSREQEENLEVFQNCTKKTFTECLLTLSFTLEIAILITTVSGIQNSKKKETPNVITSLLVEQL